QNIPRRAVEKAGPWKPWKTKSRFPTVSTAPWKSLGGIPTFPPLRRFLFPFHEQKQESPRPQADAGPQGLLAKPDRSRVNQTGQIDKLRTTIAAVTTSRLCKTRRVLVSIPS